MPSESAAAAAVTVTEPDWLLLMDNIREAARSARETATTLLPACEARRRLVEAMDGILRATIDTAASPVPIVTRGRAKLTRRQREILRYIVEFRTMHGYSPSIREICVQFEFKSPNAALGHLKSLREKGYLRYDAQVARSLVPVL